MTRNTSLEMNMVYYLDFLPYFCFSEICPCFFTAMMEKSQNRIVLCEPTELYNILQQQATVFPCLSDPNYLLLLGEILLNICILFTRLGHFGICSVCDQKLLNLT